MDPNATLDLIAEALADFDYASALEHFTNYWVWRTKGGFAPPGADSRAEALARGTVSALKILQQQCAGGAPKPAESV